MKIAVLALHLPTPTRTKSGGVAYVAHRLANGLAARGHAVTVFSTDPAPADARYRVRQLPRTLGDNPLANWVENWRVARDYARQELSGFDVVHAHGDDALLWRPGPPLVRTFHGSALSEAIHAPSGKKRIWYLSFAPREVWEAAKATVSVAVSENTRRYLPFIDRVIPNGVDPTVFFPGAQRSPQPSILFVGTLAGRKRGAYLLEQFRTHIRPRLPDATLWMVCGREVDEPGVVSYIQPGEQELAALYRQAWLFCLPSRYEGFGVPYIEAMASGTPVVATPNDGAMEVLAGGAWGVITPAERLGADLVRLLEDPEERRTWSCKGLTRAAHFHQERIVDAYEALFHSLQGRTRG